MELRKLPQLLERKRGSFSRGSRAFLHFHEDAGDFYVDARLDGAFRRARVTTGDEQADLLARVRQALEFDVLTDSSGLRGDAREQVRLRQHGRLARDDELEVLISELFEHVVRHRELRPVL